MIYSQKTKFCFFCVIGNELKFEFSLKFCVDAYNTKNKNEKVF